MRGHGLVYKFIGFFINQKERHQYIYNFAYRCLSYIFRILTVLTDLLVLGNIK